MVKTKIIKTTEKYDKDGKLVEKVTREEMSEDDTDYVPFYSYSGEKPIFPSGPICADFGTCVQCACGSAKMRDAVEKIMYHNPDGSVNISAKSVFINEKSLGGDCHCGQKS